MTENASQYIARKDASHKEKCQMAAKFHAEMAKRFRRFGNEADAKRADAFSAQWQAKADAA